MKNTLYGKQHLVFVVVTPGELLGISYFTNEQLSQQDNPGLKTHLHLLLRVREGYFNITSNKGTKKIHKYGIIGIEAEVMAFGLVWIERLG